MINTALKTQIDTDITNKTTVKSISPLNVGGNMKTIVDYVDQEKRPYKVYTALLTQTLTNAPVATILENTLVGTVVLSYSGVGQYVATLTGAFVFGKTWCSITNSGSADTIVTATRSSNDTVNISSLLSGTLSDSIMSPASLEIRVYN